jgi:Asp-tRNA(Asn)/Glu-tRNA(Gln) amidotransferase A subunit family amidase
MNDDATAQAEAVRKGDVSATELVEDAIARIEKLNPELNAVIVPLYDKARAEAKTATGPFAGVPYVLKDLGMASKGDLHAGGIKGAKEAGYRSDHDSHLVTALREAGFVLVGKTNTPELGLVPTTEPLAWGPSRNPWDTSRSTGGSSGGSAAAVAAGMVAMGHANDGGGSIRIPASQCGLVGLKPSRGRVSAGPSVGEGWGGLAIDLCVTRTVRDTAAVLDIVSGHRAGDAFGAPTPSRPFASEVGADTGRLRIGVLDADPTGGVPVDAEVVTAVRAAADALSLLGHDVADGHPAGLAQSSLESFLPCFGAWTAADLDHWGELLGRPITAEDVEPDTWAIAELGRTFSGPDFVKGLAGVRDYARAVESWWEDGWDLLLTPTIPEVPPALGTMNGWRAGAIITFTMPYNMTGQPAISVPLHWSADGLPVGVQLVAAYGREDILLRVAAQLEASVPWADRRPPIA